MNSDHGFKCFFKKSLKMSLPRRFTGTRLNEWEKDYHKGSDTRDAKIRGISIGR
jgi:hypothetical protein